MDRPDINNPAILLRPLLALVSGAVLLIVGYAGFLSVRAPQGINTEHEKVLPGKGFRAAIGSARVQGDGVEVTGYRKNRNEYHVMLTTGARFRAENYPLVSYQYRGEGAGPMLKLVWRSASNPQQLQVAELNRSPSGSGTLNMGRHPAWSGGVTEIGIYAVTMQEDEVFSLRQMQLRPYGWQAILASHWSDWRAYRGWTVKTINFILGTPDSEALSPVPAAAAWGALSLLVLVVLGRWIGPVAWPAVLIVVLVPWLALDLLWQGELRNQLSETRRQFGGKDVQQQHLADIDGHIYRYIQRLNTQLLPEKPARILLLHASKKHNYTRLKSQYYLLPHNVFNFGNIPPREALGELDYVLVLGEVPELVFEQERGRLLWQRKRTLAVERIDSDPMGQLYRVTGDGMVEIRKRD